jgi:membrane protein implicated in regulation of membrane protease activity
MTIAVVFIVLGLALLMFGADRFVDQDGIVLVDVDNSTNTGSVRVGQDEWRAISETGDILPEGTRIRVTQIDGTRAVVKTIDKEDN